MTILNRPPAQRLPSEVTSFVGRRHEVTDVKRFLSGAHVVTLTGAGGVGKTRLALRVAADVRRAFRDGVWLVELAALDTPELLVQTVAGALDIRDRSSRPRLEVLVEHLREKQALVILDNCEHLLHECAVLAETLIRVAPDLRILATSRQPLGIAGEQTLAVPPLALPDSDVPRPSVEALAQCDAVRLFAERAGAVLPDFAVTDDNREAVEGICRRLDGIPLGIELAAVRLRALSVQQLLDRLDDRFRLLTAGSRAVLPRHQTLRALIDWSYTLCTDQERLLWERVSVFSGGLGLEAAETVCSGDGIDREEIVDLVIGLVDKSVLIREEYPSGVRYRLLETIRQYGRDRLRESGEEEGLRRRHRDWCQDLVTRAEREWFGPNQVMWFTRLRGEHSNLRTALDFCLTAPGEVERGLAIATAMRFYWIAAGFLHEGRCWLNPLLAAGAERSVFRGRALCVNARLAVLQSDFTAAESMLEESRSLAKGFGDAATLAQIAYVSGLAALVRQDLTRAATLLEEALDRHRAVDDQVGEVNSLMYLATAHSCLGHSRRAVTLFETCLAMCETRSEHWFRSYVLSVFAIEMWQQGNTARAIEMEGESIRLKQPFNDRLGLALCVEVMAWIAAGRGDYECAAQLLGALRGIWRSVGGPLFGYLAGYHSQCEAVTREHLGAKKFDAALRKGVGLTFDGALACALQEKAPAGEQSEEAERPSPLTPRETEIAQLVAQGLSNKEIAASLVIAQRTAEGHIEHILSKLGFHSRAQIAVWVGERNRAADDERPPEGT
ncbi:non-specific serine/threonine protein kinase [Streptosporangium subroseum]|uniref:Non-specific serine/threonine protein kinase n=1 Tax=Streptosporangium subroseum TaxID=106412 RepID=A0A239GPE3_9ACTN|nr:LuxR C-terminal-related transcriptional regulator [Streptosporangium subroseum]SNS71069.1 non-specific serine/threonine protein kinase [Streptosporangium subroseum]